MACTLRFSLLDSGAKHPKAFLNGKWAGKLIGSPKKNTKKQKKAAKKTKHNNHNITHNNLNTDSKGVLQVPEFYFGKLCSCDDCKFAVVKTGTL